MLCVHVRTAQLIGRAHVRTAQLIGNIGYDTALLFNLMPFAISYSIINSYIKEIQTHRALDNPNIAISCISQYSSI